MWIPGCATRNENEEQPPILNGKKYAKTVKLRKKRVTEINIGLALELRSSKKDIKKK